MQERFSIVTPVLNGKRFLPELIGSLRQQTYTNWQHIIIDGGSEDGSIEIARAWQAEDKRVQVQVLPGTGLYPSILAGLRLADGDMLSWLNCDDLYAPWALASVAQYRRANRFDWLTGYPGCWDEAGVLRYVRPYGWYPRSWIRQGWFHDGVLGYLQQESMFFSRNLFEKLSQDDLDAVAAQKLAGDFVLWRVLARHAALEVLPSTLAGFRFHSENLSRDRAGVYQQEVMLSGGKRLPRWMARLARWGFQTVSAHKALKKVSAEDRRVHFDLKIR